MTNHLPCVQEHRASPDSGKFALDLVTIHHGVVPRDIFQQEPKRGDIPLPIAQRVNRTILNVLTSHPERLTKSAVCADDTQILIQDEKRIPDRIHDPLGERVHIIDIDEPVACWPRPRGPQEAGALDSSTVPYLTLTKSNQLVPRDERSATNSHTLLPRNQLREAMNVITCNRRPQENSVYWKAAS